MFQKINLILEKFKGTSVYKSFHIALSQSFVAFLFIFIDYIISKRLSVSDFGLWKEVFFILNLGIPLLSFGFTESYKYFIAKEQDKIDYYLDNLNLIFLRIGLIIFLLIGLGNILHYINIINLGPYYLYSLLFPLPLLAFLLNKALRFTYINLNEAEKLTKLSIYGALCSLVIIVLGWYALGLSAEFYIGIAIISYFSVFFFPFIFYIKNLGFALRLVSLNKGVLRNMLLYGFPLYLATFAGLFSSNLDKFIVNIFEDDATFAIFSVGAFEIPIFAMLSAAFSQQIFPNMVKFIEDGKEFQAKLLWLQTTKRVSYITYPFILTAMFFAEDLIFFIYSEDYSSSVILFKTYLLVLLFRNNNYGILLTAKGETKLITKISLFVLFTNLFASIGFYFYYGIQGIVFGTLLSTFMLWLIYLLKEEMFKDYLRIVSLDKILLVIQILILLKYFI